MSGPELVVVTDDDGASSLPKAMVRNSLRLVDCRDAAGLSSVGETPVLISVDLHDIDKVKLIKDNLPPVRLLSAGSLPSIAAITGREFKRTGLAHLSCSIVRWIFENSTNVCSAMRGRNSRHPVRKTWPCGGSRAVYRFSRRP